MRQEIIDDIRDYLLENINVLEDVARDINSWDGSLEQFDVWENDEEFFNTFFGDRPMEAVRASYYGDYKYMDEYVRFNGYGNLESLSAYQFHEELREEVDYIVELLVDKLDNLNIVDDGLNALLEQLEEGDDDDHAENE